MRPVFVFAHGAGAPSSSGWMRAWKKRLDTLGETHVFDYPYAAAGKKRPDPLELLKDAHARAIRGAIRRRKAPLVLLGKSMGSRVGCHVAAECNELARRISCLVCFGYPLRGQSGKIRDQVLLELRTPILFLQGTRDALCPLDLLASVRKRMRAKSELYVVEGGDHSLQVTKTALREAGETQDDVDRRLLERIAEFVQSSLLATRSDQRGRSPARSG
jgi:predicted alpha/beta-hydrolase family hydrolase